MSTRLTTTLTEAQDAIARHIKLGQTLPQRAVDVTNPRVIHSYSSRLATEYDQWEQTTSAMLVRIFSDRSIAHRFEKKLANPDKLVSGREPKTVQWYLLERLGPKLEYLEVTLANLPLYVPSSDTKSSLAEAPMNDTNIAVFISHSSHDAVLAEAIADLMRDAFDIPANRIRCTSVTRYGYNGGDVIPEKVRPEILGCDLLIALISEISAASTWVLMELGARWGQNHPRISLIAPGARASHIPDLLRHEHALRCDNAPDLQCFITSASRHLTAFPRQDAGAYQHHIDKIIALPPTAVTKTSSGASVAQAAPLTDPRDIKHSLTAWFRHLSDAARTELIRLADVDAQANVPSGSAARYLADIGRSQGYRTTGPGPETIRFDEDHSLPIEAQDPYYDDRV